MLKRFTHTVVPLKATSILFLFLCLFHVSVQAQNEVVDTMTVMTAEGSDSVVYFDVLSKKITAVPSRVLGDSVYARLKSEDAFWYADRTPDRQQNEPVRVGDGKKPFFLQPWFRVLLWIIVIGSFIAVLIWFLAVSNIRLFRKPPPVLHTGEDLLAEEDIFSIAYEQQIPKALQQKDYRLVIRLLYLQTLKKLSESNLIHYKAGRTNSDYLMQLQESSYYRPFFRLTRDFEYTWYGQFGVSEEAFRAIQGDFQNFHQQLPS